MKKKGEQTGDGKLKNAVSSIALDKPFVGMYEIFPRNHVI